jgi:hypothetical protein
VPVTQVRAAPAIATLNPTWTFSTGTTTARSPDWGAQQYAGAAVGDLLGDGRREVVAAGADHFLYAWDAHGTLLSGFPVNMWDTSVATPALVELDNNGRLWIIAGGDMDPHRRHLRTRVDGGRLRRHPPLGQLGSESRRRSDGLPPLPPQPGRVPLHQRLLTRRDRLGAD